jgi:glyoxylase-like metal-dependent hydrolase (beta-lactamase superfamily II)
MPCRTRSLALLSIALLAVPLGAQTGAHAARTNGAPTLRESYARAVRLIDSAVAAHGGVEALRRARRFRVISEGWDYHRTQGSRVAPPYDSTVARSDAMIDLSRGRIVRRRVRGWPGGFHYVDWYVSDSARHFYIEPRNRRYSEQQYPPADQQYGNLFLFPSWYVLAAHETANRGARRYLGRMRLGSGAEVEAVQYTIPPSGTIVIGLDPRTYRLRAAMSVGTDVFTGDTDVYTEFLDWRPMDGGLLIPARSVLHRGGEVANALRYTTATVEYTIPDSLLVPPVGFTSVAPEPPPPSVRELAPGVWTVGSGSKSLVVAFNDHVVIVDAPSSTSSEAIATVATLAPGKPIRYVVPTHHHDDHFVGVRYHIANGATVVTTAGNLDYLRRIVTAPTSSLMLARNQVPPASNYKVETIAGGKRIFTDGTRSLEIHQIASPHAQEMLVAWIPSHGILFQADLIEAPQSGVALPGANALTTMHLADVIREKRWNVRVFAGSHASLQSPGVFAEITRLPIIPPAVF